MATAKELEKIVAARIAELTKGQSESKRDHVQPCKNNFKYSTVNTGDKTVLEMALDEIEAD